MIRVVLLAALTIGLAGGAVYAQSIGLFGGVSNAGTGTGGGGGGGGTPSDPLIWFF